MTCPNQPRGCGAYSRSGSAGEPFMWYTSQPAKCGPSTFQSFRRSSDVITKAAFLVPTNTRTLLMLPPIASSYSISRFKNLAKLHSEWSGVRVETSVRTRKNDSLRPQQLRQLESAVVRHLAAGLLPDPRHDPARCLPQRVDVGFIVGDGLHVVGEEDLHVALHHGPSLEPLRRWRTPRPRRRTVVVKPCIGRELLHRGTLVPLPVNLDDLFHARVDGRRIRLQGGGGRLVGDERVQLVGMVSRQLEADGGAAAAGIHPCLLLGEVRQEAVHAVPEYLHHSLAVEWSLEIAVRQAARVVRHHGVVRGQVARNVAERRSVSRSAGHEEQHRAGSPNLVIEARARNAQSRGFDRHGLTHGLHLPDQVRQSSRLPRATKLIGCRAPRPVAFHQDSRRGASIRKLKLEPGRREPPW